jgi:hypothetical protein
LVATGGDCGGVFVWERRSGTLLRRAQADTVTVNVVAPHPWLPLLATSGINNDVKLWLNTADEEAPFAFECAQPAHAAGAAGGRSDSEASSHTDDDDEEEEEEEEEEEDRDNHGALSIQGYLIHRATRRYRTQPWLLERPALDVVMRSEAAERLQRARAAREAGNAAFGCGEVRARVPRAMQWEPAKATHGEPAEAPMFPRVVWGSLCWELAKGTTLRACDGSSVHSLTSEGGGSKGSCSLRRPRHPHPPK